MSAESLFHHKLPETIIVCYPIISCLAIGVKAYTATEGLEVLILSVLNFSERFSFLVNLYRFWRFRRFKSWPVSLQFDRPFLFFKNRPYKSILLGIHIRKYAVSRVWLILYRDTIISWWRDVRLKEDHGIGVFLIERSLVRDCVCQVLCHEEDEWTIINFKVVGRGKRGAEIVQQQNLLRHDQGDWCALGSRERRMKMTTRTKSEGGWVCAAQ